MKFLVFAIASSKIALYFEKSEIYDHLHTICSYRELKADGRKIRIIKEGTIYSCPKVIYYDPVTETWSENP